VRRIILSAALTALMAVSVPASAQYSDNRAVFDRIDRLERDIQTMQSQMSRGGPSGSTVVTSPALGGGSAYTPSPPLSSGMSVQLDDRVTQLEELVRQLNGRVEEASYKAQQIARQLERMQADIDLRFKDLQTPAGQPAAIGAAPAPINGTTGAATPMPLTRNSAEGPGLAPGPQNLGAITDKDIKKAPPAPDLPKDPQSLYDQAYALIQKGDTNGAEDEFKAFLAKYPNHSLAANANYWLADIAYNRKDFKSAAGMFLGAYKKFPDSSKAPDMLYKTGASFARVDPPMKTEACTAFSVLFQKHTQMPEHVRRAATADKQKLGCK
jgi:tol-pal system protein YbgF